MSAPITDLAKPEATKWLELFVDADPKGHVSATVPVRWHIHSDLVTKISNREFTNPHLLIVVRALSERDYDDVTITSRTNTGIYIVPLTQELQYVNFTRPGVNEVVATVINVSKNNSSDLSSWLRNPERVQLKDNGKPENWAFVNSNTEYIFTSVVARVDVPPEMFAPEPKPWQKILVKFFFPSRENDQCHFRKRLIGASVMMIFVQLYGLLVRPIIALWMLYFGFRKVKWSDIFDISPHELVNNRDNYAGTWWTIDKHNKDRGPWWFIISPVVPVIILGIPLVIFGIFSIRNNDNPLVDWGWWETVLITDGLIIAAIVVFAIGYIAVMLIKSAIQGLHLKNGNQATNQIPDAEREKLLASLRTMSLNRDTRVSLSALPKEKQTIALRFYDLKARVCRPFAR
ncbi:MAG: hypothetical protein ABI220_00770 [Candidatus Saccharimonadales bacterium]